MKKIILFLSIALMLVSCTSKNEGEVVLFNDITFRLNDGEEIISIDSSNKEIYHSYIDPTSFQIPLFRCIKDDNHTIFLGIPINASLKGLSNYNWTHNNNQSFFESDSTNYFYLSYQNKGDVIAMYSENFDNNLVYILAISNSVKLSDSLFNKNALSKRFTK